MFSYIWEFLKILLINKIRKYMVFCAWFISFSTISLKASMLVQMRVFPFRRTVNRSYTCIISTLSIHLALNDSLALSVFGALLIMLWWTRGMDGFISSVHILSFVCVLVMGIAWIPYDSVCILLHIYSKENKCPTGCLSQH